MMTLRGDVPEETLKVLVVEEPVPCGVSVTTKYFLDGELVRQDVEIKVEKGCAIGTEAGTISQ